MADANGCAIQCPTGWVLNLYEAVVGIGGVWEMGDAMVENVNMVDAAITFTRSFAEARTNVMTSSYRCHMSLDFEITASRLICTEYPFMTCAASTDPKWIEIQDSNGTTIYEGAVIDTSGGVNFSSTEMVAENITFQNVGDPAEYLVPAA